MSYTVAGTTVVAPTSTGPTYPKKSAAAAKGFLKSSKGPGYGTVTNKSTVPLAVDQCCADTKSGGAQSHLHPTFL